MNNHIPQSWINFVQNIAESYSEPLNSAISYRSIKDRKVFMGKLRENAQKLLDEMNSVPPIYQYFYKENNCKASSAASPDCICWHDEGDGPFSELKYEENYKNGFYWRVKSTG